MPSKHASLWAVGFAAMTLAFGGAWRAAQAASPQPTIPPECAGAWAPYGGAGDPVRPGGPYVAKGVQVPSQIITITVTKVTEGKVRGQAHFTATGFDSGMINFQGKLVGPDIFTWTTYTNATLLLKQFDDGLGGYIDSVVYRACSPMSLTKALAAK